MMSEHEVSERLKAAAEAMPLRTVPYEQVLTRAKPQRRRFLAALAAVVVVVGGLSIAGAMRIAGLLADEEADHRIDPAELEDGLTRERIDPIVDSFVSGLRDGRASDTWDLLTPRARDAIGGLDAWRDTLGDVKYLFTWIGRRPFDLYVTSLPGGAAIVTAAEHEPHQGAWFLTTFPVRDVTR